MTDPAVRRQVEAMLEKVSALPTVASVASPFAPGGAAQIAGRRSGRVRERNARQAGDRGHARARPKELRRHGRGLPATASRSRSRTGREGGEPGQCQQRRLRCRRGARRAAARLRLAARRHAAAAHGRNRARSSVAAISLLSHLMSVASFSSELALLIGLGVGVDYALFIVARHRQGLQRGKTTEQADRRRRRHLRPRGACSPGSRCASRCSACSSSA